MRSLFLLSAVLLLGACTTTKKMSVWSYDEKVVERYKAANPTAKVDKEEDCASMIVVVPTGLPDPFEALDEAQKRNPGMAFVGGEFITYFWQIPPFYARICTRFEGTPVKL